jgi:predicted RNase H-like HicB family nuclease
MLEHIQTHHFHFSGEVVITGLDPETRKYVAFNRDVPNILGHGQTRLSAIADLGEKADLQREDADEDEQAARFDHAYDLRKHAA